MTQAQLNQYMSDAVTAVLSSQNEADGGCDIIEKYTAYVRNIREIRNEETYLCETYYRLTKGKSVCVGLSPVRNFRICVRLLSRIGDPLSLSSEEFIELYNKFSVIKHHLTKKRAYAICGGKNINNSKSSSNGKKQQQQQQHVGEYRIEDYIDQTIYDEDDDKVIIINAIQITLTSFNGKNAVKIKMNGLGVFDLDRMTYTMLETVAPLILSRIAIFAKLDYYSMYKNTLASLVHSHDHQQQGATVVENIINFCQNSPKSDSVHFLHELAVFSPSKIEYDFNRLKYYGVYETDTTTTTSATTSGASAIAKQFAVI